MGRWKLGPQGGYYDPNDSGPDQYNPTPAERASQGGGEQGGYAPPTGGVSGYGGGMNPHPGQPMPSPFEKFPGQGPRPQGPWMPTTYDSGLKPPSDYWTTPVDWNDPASQWRGWTNPDGSPVNPSNPRAGANPPPWSLGTLNGSIGQQGQPFGSGASMGAPKSSRGGLLGGLFMGLGSLNGAAGNAIGPYGTPR